MLTIYGDHRSGNCWKVLWTARLLNRPHQWVETAALNVGATKTPAFLAINPFGEVPAVTLEDGRPLAQSNAIIGYLAHDSHLIPTDPYQQAQMRAWMFWEQYSHEPYIAVRRALVALLGRDPNELDPKLLERGQKALEIMNSHLQGRTFFVGAQLSLADIALFAYSCVAQDGGYDLSGLPALRDWLARMHDALAPHGKVNDVISQE